MGLGGLDVIDKTKKRKAAANDIKWGVNQLDDVFSFGKGGSKAAVKAGKAASSKAARTAARKGATTVASRGSTLAKGGRAAQVARAGATA